MTSAEPVRARLRWHPRSLILFAGGIGTLGMVLWALAALNDPRRGLAAYLFAYVAVLTVVAGALLQLMMSDVTGANWFTVLRRLSLATTGTFPILLAMVFLVIAGVHQLYSWASPGAGTLHQRQLALERHAWLNVPFFAVRAVLYVAILTVFAELLRRAADAEDSATSSEAVVAAVRRQRRLSAGGLVACGLAVTFIAFDWLMPLDPEWYSTVYGVYVFSGGFLGALGLLALSAAGSVRNGALDGVVTVEHFGALGKLTLTFVVFWFYIAFAQYLVIWIGDIPADSSWYVVRGEGSWRMVGMAVAAGQFAVPLVVLLPRRTKRNMKLMGWLGAWLLAMHVLDSYWLVLPAIHPSGFAPGWPDLFALTGTAGWATAFGAWRAMGRSALPVHSPTLALSENYVEP